MVPALVTDPARYFADIGPMANTPLVAMFQFPKTLPAVQPIAAASVPERVNDPVTPMKPGPLETASANKANVPPLNVSAAPPAAVQAPPSVPPPCRSKVPLRAESAPVFSNSTPEIEQALVPPLF